MADNNTVLTSSEVPLESCVVVVNSEAGNSVVSEDDLVQLLTAHANSGQSQDLVLQGNDQLLAVDTDGEGNQTVVIEESDQPVFIQFQEVVKSESGHDMWTFQVLPQNDPQAMEVVTEEKPSVVYLQGDIPLEPDNFIGTEVECSTGRDSDSTYYESDTPTKKRRRSVMEVHECQNCELSFASMKDYRIHMREHTESTKKGRGSGKQNHHCNICGESFSNIKRYKSHIRIHISAFVCPICCIGYSRGGDLTRHIHQNHPENDSFPCLECHEKFSSAKLRQRHMRGAHKNRLLYACDTCGKIYKRLENLKDHLRIHTGQRPFSCVFCRLTFARYNAFRSHLRTHKETEKKKNRSLPQRDKPFSCKNCERSYSTTKALFTHMKDAHQLEKSYACSICGQKFTFKIKLNEHMTRHLGNVAAVKLDGAQNPESLPLVCVTCNERFDSQEDMDFHMKYHGEKFLSKYGTPGVSQPQNVERKLFPCQICKRLLSSSRSLKLHMSEHTGNKRFGCDICGKRFALKSHYVRHYVTHTGKKKYGCYVCDKRFFEYYRLKRHIEVHTRERTCPICSSTFANEKKLNTHMIYHVKLQEELLCDVCAESFLSKEELMKHKLVHVSKEDLDLLLEYKPYFCEICGKACTTPSTLKKHIKTHSNETYLKSFACDQCDKAYSCKGNLGRHKRAEHGDTDSVTGQMDVTEGQQVVTIEVTQAVGDVLGLSMQEANLEELNIQNVLDVEHAKQQTSSKAQSEEETPEPQAMVTYYNCAQCEKSFQSLKNLDEHLQQCGKVEMMPHTSSFVCQSCGKHYAAQKNLDEHIRYHCRGFKVNNDCKICSQDYTLHRRPSKAYACCVCYKTFPFLNRMKYHQAIHMDQREKQFPCVLCNKAFFMNSDLKKHMKLHTGVKPYGCPVCDKKFQKPSNLKRHVTQVHEGVKRDRKKSQGKSKRDVAKVAAFKQRVMNILDQVGSNKGDENDPNASISYESNQLEKALPIIETKDVTHPDFENFEISENVGSNDDEEATVVDAHMKYETGIKIETRKEIKIETRKEIQIETREVENKKPGPKIHSCPDCSKEFKKMNQLVSHMRSHTGEKPFSCDVCQQAYSLKSSLQRHMSVHEPQKPYSCGVCGKRFNHRVSVVRHMHTHTDGPSVCSICKMAFLSRTLLFEHRKTHVNEPMANSKPQHQSQKKNQKVIDTSDSSLDPESEDLADEFNDTDDKLSSETLPRRSARENIKNIHWSSFLDEAEEEPSEPDPEETIDTVNTLPDSEESENVIITAVSQKRQSTSSQNKKESFMQLTIKSEPVDVVETPPKKPVALKSSEKNIPQKKDYSSAQKTVVNKGVVTEATPIKRVMPRAASWKRYSLQNSPTKPTTCTVKPSIPADTKMKSSARKDEFSKKRIISCHDGYIHVCNEDLATEKSTGKARNTKCRKVSPENPHLCDECGDTFKNLLALKKHQEVHRGRFPCKTCSRVFNSRYRLNCHAETHEFSNPLTNKHVTYVHNGKVHKYDSYQMDLNPFVQLSEPSDASSTRVANGAEIGSRNDGSPKSVKSVNTFMNSIELKSNKD